MTGSPLPRFLALYGILFAAFGVSSPFLPRLLQQDGLGVDALGVVLSAATAIRLLAGPLGGRLADWTGQSSLVLTILMAASAVMALGYLPARGLPLLLLVCVAHAIVLAPLTPIADALALGSGWGENGFEYGWVRATGSAGFIIGTLASGQAIGRFGLEVIVWLFAALLAAATCFAWTVPNKTAGAAVAMDKASASVRMLFHIPAFRRLMAVAALVGGSHALHDSFGIIRWHAAGLSTSQSSLLWSSSVAAEVVVFLFLGRRTLERFGPGHAMIFSALAGILRWVVTARTAWFPAMVLVEPLHGLTFALLHLACMDVINRVIPAKLAATAQAFYATVALGATAAAITLASGPLYNRFGPGAFWAMAAMCVAALPFAIGMRLPSGA